MNLVLAPPFTLAMPLLTSIESGGAVVALANFVSGR
jgi:hypothetical protein